MKHKVRCALCGKEQTIPIDERTGKIKSKWAYFSKMNVNVDKTSKYLYESKNPNNPIDFNKSVKVLNPNYNPEIKLKYIEYWECPKCYLKGDDKHN
jgi:hypothetical protein